MGDVGTTSGPRPAIGPDDRYRLVREIGSGAMGTVHEGRDTVLDRPVAVKLIDRRLSTDPTFHRRFANEAAILARLDGRAIVRIYDFGATQDGLYLVTQFLPDGDLGTWLRAHGPLSPRRAALVTADVCDALDQAHGAEIVHRDVKPGNVLLRSVGDSLEAYLADFGIARPHDSELTATGEVLGTPAYMAPEQHLGEDASAAGDLYAAGCVLWCALSGRRPYDGTPHQQAVGHIEGPVPQLVGDHEWHDRLNPILARALAKEPAERFDDAAQMAAALRDVATRLPHDVEREGGVDALAEESTLAATPEESPRRPPRALMPAGLVVVLVLALGGGGWGWWSHTRHGAVTAASSWLCADGSLVAKRSRCTLPAGAAGMTAVFPRSAECAPATAPTETAGRTFARSCDFTATRGFRITYSAWSSHDAAVEHYELRQTTHDAATVRALDWRQHGEDAGERWTITDKILRASFLYDDADYSVSVSGSSERGLEAAIAYVLNDAANPPSAFLPQRAG